MIDTVLPLVMVPVPIDEPLDLNVTVLPVRLPVPVTSAVTVTDCPTVILDCDKVVVTDCTTGVPLSSNLSDGYCLATYKAVVPCGILNRQDDGRPPAQVLLSYVIMLLEVSQFNTNGFKLEQFSKQLIPRLVIVDGSSIEVKLVQL